MIDHDEGLMQRLLQAVLYLARDQYYNRTPVISDDDYDNLVDIEINLRKRSPDNDPI